MDEKVYFSKVEFREYVAYDLHSILLINFVEGTLMYQVYKKKLNKQFPVITGIQAEEIGKCIFESKVCKLAVRMKNFKNDFKPEILPTDDSIYEVEFSYTYKFTEDEMKELLKYCNALEFEPYREKEMSMEDEGYIGYRDEVSLYFTGITDSYIPMMELPMNYFYDEEHIWPSERLYRYIMRTFMKGKKVKKWIVPYGGLSLF